MDYTSTGLISQIKRRALIPTSQNLFTSTDIIDMINEELQNRIIPYIMSVREDYYLTYDEYTIDGTFNSLDIPSNAIGNKINQISVYSGNINDEFIGNIARLTVSQLSNGFSGYYLEGNKIKFYPNLQYQNLYKLRIYYYRRPSEVVAITDCGLINTVNTNTSIVCDTLPATITTGSSIDIVNNNQPWDTLSRLTAGTVNLQTIDLTDTTNISVGNYVALRNKSPYAQVPQDVIPLLIQAVVVRMLEYMGDSQGLQNSMLTYAQMESDNRALISPRVDNQPKKIVNSNRLRNYLPR